MTRRTRTCGRATREMARALSISCPTSLAAGCAPRQSERGRRKTHEARRETHEASRAPVLSGVHARRRHAGRRKIVRGGRLVGREGRHDVARLGVGQKGQGSADTNFLSGLVLG